MASKNRFRFDILLLVIFPLRLSVLTSESGNSFWRRLCSLNIPCIQQLRAEGHRVVTRATYTDASATISHDRPIVKHFLLNYTETEIGRRLNHTLARVEGYIKDFLRIAVAHRQGYTPEGIRHLTGLAKGVVEKHLAHYAELSVSPFWREHLERKLRFYEVSIGADVAKKGALS